MKIRKIGSRLEKAALFVTRPGIAGFSVFLLLLILNCDSLTAPPFWDDIIGLHTQAVWLARNNFDFSALAAFESSSGTPCYNLLSPLALFYALCYRFLSPVMTHTAAHLVNIISIAGCSFFLMQMTRKCSPSVRAAALAGALTTPLIVSACAGTGQESVLALLIMAGLNWYSCKKDLRSWASSIGAWFIKLTAVFLTASFAADLFFRKFRKGEFSLKKFILPLLLLIGGGIYYFWHFSHVTTHLKWKPGEFFRLLVHGYTLILPLFLLVLPVLGRRIFSRRTLPCCLFLLLFWGANAFSSMLALPRYGVVTVFPVFYLCALAAERLRSKKLFAVIAAAVLAVNLLNVYGSLLPAPRGIELHDGSFLERSREFTLMRQQDQEFCRNLENSEREKPLVCTWPMLQMLTVPEFGYVSAPLKNVYSGEYPHPLGNYRMLNKEVLKEKPFFIYTPDCYNWKIPAGARIIFASNPGNPPAGYLIWSL